MGTLLIAPLSVLAWIGFPISKYIASRNSKTLSKVTNTLWKVANVLIFRPYMIAAAAVATILTAINAIPYALLYGPIRLYERLSENTVQNPFVDGLRDRYSTMVASMGISIGLLAVTFAKELPFKNWDRLPFNGWHQWIVNKIIGAKGMMFDVAGRCETVKKNNIVLPTRPTEGVAYSYIKMTGINRPLLEFYDDIITGPARFNETMGHKPRTSTKN
jgi:hypothetical protein